MSNPPIPLLAKGGEGGFENSFSDKYYILPQKKWKPKMLLEGNRFYSIKDFLPDLCRRVDLYEVLSFVKHGNEDILEFLAASAGVLPLIIRDDFSLLTLPAGENPFGA